MPENRLPWVSMVLGYRPPRPTDGFHELLVANWLVKCRNRIVSTEAVVDDRQVLES